MTDTTEQMPFNIWAYTDKTEGYGGHWFDKPAPVDDGSDTVRYTNTAEAIEKIRGERKQVLTNHIVIHKDLTDSAKDILNAGKAQGYNQAIKDAIDILEGE